MTKITLLLGAAAIALLSIPPVSASAQGDQKLARRAVLHRADVPDVFEESSVTDSTGGSDGLCGEALATADEAANAAPHASSAFTLAGTEGYAVINSTVAVFAKVGKAKAALAAYEDDEAAEACVQRRLEQFLTEPGVTNEITVGAFAPELDDKGSKKVIKGGDEFAGFSMNARRFVEGGQPDFYEGMFVVGRAGRAIFRLTFISQGTVPRDDVQAMTQDVVRRLERGQ